MTQVDDPAETAGPDEQTDAEPLSPVDVLDDVPPGGASSDEAAPGPASTRPGAQVFNRAAWVVVAAQVVLVLTILLGISQPSPVLLAQGYQMVLLAPAWVVLATALVGRRWRLALVAACVVIAHLGFSVPSATADPKPTWAADAPKFSLLTANVYYRNADKDAVARALLRADADVIVLNEITPAQRQALDDVGVTDRYPHSVFTSDTDVFGEMVLTRLPASDVRIEHVGNLWIPALTVRVGKESVRIRGIHVRAPITFGDADYWRSQLEAVGQLADSCSATRCVFAGDFNSGEWHGPFRDLMSHGLSDAHQALGDGLSRSWPVTGARSLLGPLVRLDHVLFGTRIAAQAVDDVTIPGSDHRASRVSLAVRSSAPA